MPERLFESDVCKVCGCTEDNACMTDEGPCHWAMKNVCSACIIELPPGENCFIRENVGLIIRKECENCALIVEGEPHFDKKWYTCSQGRFDGPKLSPGAHQYFTWGGIQRPNKAVAKAQKHCPFFRVHDRYRRPPAEVK